MRWNKHLYIHPMQTNMLQWEIATNLWLHCRFKIIKPLVKLQHKGKAMNQTKSFRCEPHLSWNQTITWYLVCIDQEWLNSRSGISDRAVLNGNGDRQGIIRVRYMILSQIGRKRPLRNRMRQCYDCRLLMLCQRSILHRQSKKIKRGSGFDHKNAQIEI